MLLPHILISQLKASPSLDILFPTSRSDTSLLSLPFSPAWHIWFSHWKLPPQASFSSSSLISAPAAVATSGLLWALWPQWREAQQTPALPRAPKVSPSTKENRSVPHDWALTPQQALFQSQGCSAPEKSTCVDPEVISSGWCYLSYKNTETSPWFCGPFLQKPPPPGWGSRELWIPH